MMHEPVALVGAWLKRVVEGYYRYHAVPGNLSVLSRFRERLCRYWRHVLRRRSQRRKPDWDRLRPIFDRWIPRPPHSSSISRCPFRRSYPREEPYAVIPPVRILCGGDQ